MEDNARLELEKKIESEIVKTKNQITEYKELTQPIAPENAIGRISRMDAINNKSVLEAALRKAEEKLSQLEFMQMKTKQDDFGICKKCKKDIPMGRLLLMPQSIFCVHCSR